MMHSSETLPRRRREEDRPLNIGNVSIPSKLALAPMAGVTDAAFRPVSYTHLTLTTIGG